MVPVLASFAVAMVEIREESPTPGEHGTPEASAPPSTGTHSHSVPTHPNLTVFDFSLLGSE